MTNSDQAGGKTVRAQLLSLALVAIVVYQLYLSSKVGVTPRGTPAREALQHAHYSNGLLALLLVVPRLWLWRQLARPAIPQRIPTAADDLARKVNLAFLVTVLLFGITGPLFAWAEGHAISFFGLFTLPALMGSGYRPSVTLGYVHSAIGFWVFYLAAFAVLLAIYQSLRYRVPLLRMLPFIGWGR